MGIGGEMVDVVFKHRGKGSLCLQAFVRNGFCRCAELPHGGALRFMSNPGLQKEISQRHGEPCNWERCLCWPLQMPNFGKTGNNGAWMMAVSRACGQVAAFIRPWTRGGTTRRLPRSASPFLSRWGFVCASCAGASRPEVFGCLCLRACS